MWTHIPALATETFDQPVQLDFLLPWWFVRYSPQTHFLAAELAAAAAISERLKHL